MRHDAERALAVSYNKPSQSNWSGGVQTDNVSVTNDFTVEMFYCYADWNEGKTDATPPTIWQTLFALETATRSFRIRGRSISAFIRTVVVMALA